MEKFYHLIGWTYPIVSGAMGWMAGLYAPLGPWCWVKAEYSGLRLAIYYIPLWCCMVYNAIVVAMVVRKIFKVLAGCTKFFSGDPTIHHSTVLSELLYHRIYHT